MIIRRATASDAPQLQSKLQEFDLYMKPLLSEAVRPVVAYLDPEKTFATVIKQWINDPEFMLFVAEENDQLLGHICGSVHTRTFQALNREGVIEEWFVSQEYRGQGVGRQLYETLLAEFKTAGCTHITLKVFSDNHEAIERYRRLGWHELEQTFVALIKD